MPSHYCPSCTEVLEASDAERCPACSREEPAGGWPRDSLLGQLVAGEQLRVLRRLGAGGFGVVYEVETRVGGLRRALKVLAQQWHEDEVVRERFVNEALVLEQVHHPNVARCYAAGYIEQRRGLYLLFELIDGVQLDQLMPETEAGTPGRLQPARAVRLCKQIAAALQAAHDNGVLHRDLKPENILVVHSGTPAEYVKVIDFGIAKLTEQGVTATQSIIGTPEYMAPEQFLPGTTLDGRTDIWQLGATLFTALTGRPPYVPQGPGGIPAIVSEQRRHWDLGPAPSDVEPDLEEFAELDHLVARMLASDQDSRPTSAAEVCEELARIELDMSNVANRRGADALLAALCTMPSDAGWMALQGFLAGQSDQLEELTSTASELMAGWPDELRCASLAGWDAARRGQQGAAWKLVRTLDLSGRSLEDDDLARLADNRALAGITRLVLSHNAISDDGLVALARSPHLGGLQHLDLGDNRITSRGLRALIDSDVLRGLRSLRLSHNAINADGAGALAGAHAQLRRLDLSGNLLGPAGAIALAFGSGLDGLRELRVVGNRIRSEGVAALVSAVNARSLRVLDVSRNDCGPAGAAAVARSENLRALRYLGIAQNHLGREGMHALTAALALDALEELDLSGNAAGAGGVILLGAAPFVRRLRSLELADNELGDAGVAALLGSPHLAGLRRLGLAHNALGAAGAALLREGPAHLESMDLSANPLSVAADSVAEAARRLRLTTLRLQGCSFDGDALARVLHTEGLRHVDISRNALGIVGAELLAKANGLGTVHTLTLAGAQLGPEGLAALLRGANLDNVRTLDVSSNGLGDAGAKNLVVLASRLPRLEALTLDNNDLGVETVAALSVAPFAPRLFHLGLAHNSMDDHAAEVLAAGRKWHALRELDLQDNEISLAGASAVTASAHLGAVQRLDLSDNALKGLLDLHSLSRLKIGLMEASFARVAEVADEFSAWFYRELFERVPSVKPLFAGVSMPKQRQHLVKALSMVIDNLRHPDRIVDMLVELGRRHVTYGATPVHYRAVNETLLDSLEAVLGEGFDRATRDAWADGLTAISSIMTSAYRPSVSRRLTAPAMRPTSA